MMVTPYERPSTRPGEELALPGVIGASEAIREVARTTRQVAPARACVLIVGETGRARS